MIAPPSQSAGACVMKRIILISGLLFAFASSAGAVEKDDNWYWDQFNDAAHKRCPSHHIDFFTDGQYDDVLGDFLKKYPAKVRDHISDLVDYQKNCAAETAGFTCEFSMHLRIFHQMKMFDDFIRYSCAHWKCEEYSMCEMIK